MTELEPLAREIATGLTSGGLVLLVVRSWVNGVNERLKEVPVLSAKVERLEVERRSLSSEMKRISEGLNESIRDLKTEFSHHTERETDERANVAASLDNLTAALKERLSG